MMMITQEISATPRTCSVAWRSESINNSRNLLSIHTIPSCHGMVHWLGSFERKEAYSESYIVELSLSSDHATESELHFS